ncbi:MAG: hypothetical protein IKW51_11140 [Bacteroidales bacterium]|nr:hypothetical protein [Bacteroidales bacterium]
MKKLYLIILLLSMTFIGNAQKWTDVVTSKPETFIVDNDGNITISDEAGFAWLVSVVNGLNGENANSLAGKTITISNDIDMSDYEWTPIKNFEGIMKGNDNTIKGLPLLKIFAFLEGEFQFDIQRLRFVNKNTTIEFP